MAPNMPWSWTTLKRWVYACIFLLYSCIHVYACYIYVFTYIHAYSCMHVYPCYIHEFIQISAKKRILNHVYVLIYVYVCIYVCIGVYVFMCVCGRMDTYTYIHTYRNSKLVCILLIHTYKHTYIYTYIHTFIHTYIHTYMHTGTANSICISLGDSCYASICMYM